MQNEEWQKLDLTLRFSGKDTQALIEALAMLPYHISANFIAAVQQQTAPQIMEFELKIAKKSSSEKESV